MVDVGPKDPVKQGGAMSCRRTTHAATSADSYKRFLSDSNGSRAADRRQAGSGRLRAFDIHLACNRVVSIARESVDAGSNKEVRLQFVGEAEKFINVAFAISYMNATLRLGKQCCGLP